MEPKMFNHESDPDGETLDPARVMPLMHGDQTAAHLPAGEPAAEPEPAG